MTYDELLKELKKHGAFASMDALKEAHGAYFQDHLTSARQSGARAMRQGIVLAIRTEASNLGVGGSELRRYATELASRIEASEID